MKSVLLIGMGRFGLYMAKKLSALGHEVMAVDCDENKINEALPYTTTAQIGDSTNEAFLRTLGVAEFDACIVTIGNDFQSSLETTSLLKEMGAKLVVARAERDLQEKFLLRNGADEVIYPEKQVASWAAIRYTADHILDYIEIDEKYAMYEVTVPDNWSGRAIAQLDVRKKHKINIIAVKQDGKLNFTISPDMVLLEGETLLVVGERKDVQKCFKL